MAKFELNRPIVTKEPAIVVDAGLEPGEYVFQLIVQDEQGNRSVADQQIVQVVRRRDQRIIDPFQEVPDDDKQPDVLKIPPTPVLPRRPVPPRKPVPRPRWVTPDELADELSLDAPIAETRALPAELPTSDEPTAEAEQPTETTPRKKRSRKQK